MCQHHEVQQLSEEVESTALQEIREAEGDGKEEVPNQFCSLRIEQVYQVPVLVNYSMLLPRLLCSALSTPRSRWEVVDCCVLLPSTELVTDLYVVFGCCHGG